MRSAFHIARRWVSGGLLFALISLFGVNSLLACSAVPDSHTCCRRVPGKHPCDVPESPSVYPLLVAAAMNHQDFTPLVGEVPDVPAIEAPAIAIDAPAPVVDEFDTGPPGARFFVLRI